MVMICLENNCTTLDVFFITAALMVGTAGLPHVIVRFFTVKKVSDARKSAGWALLFIAITLTYSSVFKDLQDSKVLKFNRFFNHGDVARLRQANRFSNSELS